MPAVTKYDAWVPEDQGLCSYIVFKVDFSKLKETYGLSEIWTETCLMNDLANLLNLKGNLYFEQITDYTIENKDYYFLIEY